MIDDSPDDPSAVSTDTTEWWTDRDELAAFLCHLIDEHPSMTPGEVIAVVEQPWKWDEEYRIFDMGETDGTDA
jgi:hypothetical protein